MISLPREKRLLLDILESEFDSGSTSNFFWEPGIWHHDRNHIVTTNAQNNYILFEFCPSITNESTHVLTAGKRSRPTWSELLWLPSGLRFRLAVDHRTNDSSSVCGVCEAYYISTHCILCTLSAIVFLPIRAWIWCHIRRYLDGSAILLTVNGPVLPSWLKISPCVTTKIMWSETAFR